jgi:hypothetical protein
LPTTAGGLRGPVEAADALDTAGAL